MPLSGLAAVAAILLSESLFGGKVLAPLDTLLEYAPWSEVRAPERAVANPLLLDQAIVVLPWLEFCRGRLSAGSLPLWNPDNYLGQPMLATWQSAVFWPLNWVHFALPGWGFLAVSAFIRLWAAGGFMFAFLRKLGRSAGSAAVGGVAFMLCGFMIAWLNHPQTNVALFLPLLFLLVERIRERPVVRSAAPLALAFALQLFAGHVQTSAHISLACLAYALYRLRGRALALWFAGCSAGVLLAGPQILPFAEYLSASQGAHVHGTTFAVTGEGAPAASILMIDPDRFGSPRTGDWSGPTGHNLNYNELIGGYVGRLVLALAGVGLILSFLRARSGVRAPGGTWFFGAMACVTFLVAYQIPPVYGWVASLPALSSTKLMRFSLLLAFSLAALGAGGADLLRERLRLKGRSALVAGVVVFGIASGELLAFGRGYNPALDPGELLPATPVTDFLSRDDSLHRVLSVDNRGLLPNANLFYGVSMVGGYDSIERREVTELVGLMSTDERARIFIKEIRWFDRARPLAGLLGVKYVLSEVELPPPLRVVRDGACRVYENPAVLPRAFLATRVQVIEDREARLAHLGSEDMDPYVAVLERAPPSGLDEEHPGRLGPAGTVAVTRYEPTSVALEGRADREGLVVLTDAWAPGWRARLGDREVEIERVDHALRGVWVPRGAFQIEMWYDPGSFRLGLISCFLGALLVVWMALARAPRLPG